MMNFRHALIVVALLTGALPLAAQDQIITPTPTPVTAEVFRSINVRNGPGTGYDIIGALHAGDTVNVLGRNDEEGNWLFIDTGTEFGWVAYFTVVLSGNADLLPIMPADVVFALDGNDPPDSPSPVTSANSDIYVTSYRRVNVRSGPGIGFPILGVLSPGSTADIVGSSGTRNQWLEIEYNGITGWVAYFAVNVSGDLSALDNRRPETDVIFDVPDGESPGPEPTLATNQVLVITRFNTNLRARPELESEILVVIPYGTTLDALERTPDNNWLRVIYEDQTGWLITSLVNPGVSDINALPTPEPPPDLTASES